MTTVRRVLDQVREYDVSRLERAIAGVRRGPDREIEAEAALCDSNGVAAREAVLDLPSRVDFCVVEDGSVSDMVRIDTEKMLSFAPLEFEWAGGMRVVLLPFRWDYCQIMLPPTVADPSPLTQWFDRWCDEDDTAGLSGGGTAGVVHFMSDPKARAANTLFTVDLGSAPVEAFEGLLDALAATGQKRVEVGQYGE